MRYVPIYSRRYIPVTWDEEHVHVFVLALDTTPGK